MYLNSRRATAAGEMVPLGTVMELKDIVDADRVNRYNLYPSAEINGAGKPGVSSGQAIAIMADIAKEDASARDELRMDGVGVSRRDRWQHGALYLSALRVVCVSDALGRIRKLFAFVGHYSDRADVSCCAALRAFISADLITTSLRKLGSSYWPV